MRSIVLVGLLAFAEACTSRDLDALVPRTDIPPQHTTSELLQYGGNTPMGLDGIRWLTAHVPDVEASPFDGIMLNMDFGGWPYNNLTEAAFQEHVSLLKSAPFSRLKANFQLATVSPMEFADDAAFDAAIANVRVMARVVRAAGLRGIFLDTQAYGSYDFSPEIACLPPVTFAACEAKVKLRGQAFMRAWIEEYPEVTVLTSLAYAQLFVTTCLRGAPLSASRFALLPAFLDGMEAARVESRTSATIVDVFLPSYPTRDPLAFRLYYDLIHFDWKAATDHWVSGVVTYTFVPGATLQTEGETPWPDVPTLNCSEEDRMKLSRSLSAGFGLDLDWDARNRGDKFYTDPGEFSRNYHSPEQFEKLVRTALGTADRYVWVWGNVNWWSTGNDQGRVRVPEAYVQAVERAKLF